MLYVTSYKLICYHVNLSDIRGYQGSRRLTSGNQPPSLVRNWTQVSGIWDVSQNLGYPCNWLPPVSHHDHTIIVSWADLKRLDSWPGTWTWVFGLAIEDVVWLDQEDAISHISDIKHVTTSVNHYFYILH